MPVWHVSISLRTPAGYRLSSRTWLERAAPAFLAGVGGDREWWHWNARARVGHLRVPVTTDEYQLIPPGLADSDAGETGPERPRTPGERTT